jgi:superfamily II DNA/RNA helicase
VTDGGTDRETARRPTAGASVFTICANLLPRRRPASSRLCSSASKARETSIESANPSPWTDWSFVTVSTPPSAPVRFGDLGVPRALTDVLDRQGILSPFPIQAATLPDAMSGRDVCGKAPTGAGKTLAFGLAILSRLETAPRAGRGRRRHPSALVLVPTRELAAQIETDLAPLAKALGAGVTSVYGGVGYGKQLAALRNGVDVLIACPGRLTDLVERGSVDLSFVTMVVIDEADRMADMGFLPVVRRLVDRTGDPRQVLLFSATLDGPVDRLVRDYQRDPVRHEVRSAAADRGAIHHHFWRVERQHRVAVTAETITARGPAIVFCRTKRGADRLSDRLARSGLDTAAIHGDRSQSQRERALAAFRSGRLDALVATDVAARGIHVDAVPLVVHFDPPADHTDYVHRAGRTGRAGADGIVVSLVEREHVAGTERMQKRLGLTGRISAPDVRALATVDRTGRTASARPPTKGHAGPGSGTAQRPAGSGTAQRPAGSGTAQRPAGSRTEQRPAGSRRDATARNDGARRRTRGQAQRRSRQPGK